MVKDEKVICGTCFLSQTNTGQKMCKHGNHLFKLYVPPPPREIPLSAKRSEPVPVPVQERQMTRVDPMSEARLFLGIS